MTRKYHLIAALLLFFISGCADQLDTPEQQLRAVLKAMESSIEDRSMSELFDHVSEEYRDHRGNDKSALRRIAQVYLIKNQRIKVITSIKSLDIIDATTATLEGTMVLGSKSEITGELLPHIRADSQQISAVFRRENDAWKLSSLSWENQGRY